MNPCDLSDHLFLAPLLCPPALRHARGFGPSTIPEFFGELFRCFSRTVAPHAYGALLVCCLHTCCGSGFRILVALPVRFTYFLGETATGPGPPFSGTSTTIVQPATKLSKRLCEGRLYSGETRSKPAPGRGGAALLCNPAAVTLRATLTGTEPRAGLAQILEFSATSCCKANVHTYGSEGINWRQGRLGCVPIPARHPHAVSTQGRVSQQAGFVACLRLLPCFSHLDGLSQCIVEAESFQIKVSSRRVPRAAVWHKQKRSACELSRQYACIPRHVTNAHAQRSPLRPPCRAHSALSFHHYSPPAVLLTCGVLF